MDPDMVREQFEEEAEAKRRAKAGAGAVSVVSPAGPSAVVAVPAVIAASPPAARADASAVPVDAPVPLQVTLALPGEPEAVSGLPAVFEEFAIVPVPPVVVEEVPVIVEELAVVYAMPATAGEVAVAAVPAAAVEDPIILPAQSAEAQEAAAPSAPIPVPPVPEPPAPIPARPIPLPPIPVPWAAWAAAAALGHIEGALAGQGLALFLAGRLQFEPLHTLLLTVLCAYLCAIFIAALFTADPVFTDRVRFLRSLGAGAIIAAICMQTAMIGSGVFASGTAALAETAAWAIYAGAAGFVFVIVWPLNLLRLKWAARPPG
jgi:hypothetical protein